MEAFPEETGGIVAEPEDVTGEGIAFSEEGGGAGVS